MIDDDDYESFMVERIVHREGLPVDFRFFLAGEEAMRALEVANQKEFPNLIVCDVKMPGMTGFEFLDWLRHSPFRETPLVLSSNSAMRKDVNRAYALGANSYQTKPLTMEGLTERIRRLLEYWSNCEEPEHTAAP